MAKFKVTHRDGDDNLYYEADSFDSADISLTDGEVIIGDANNLGQPQSFSGAFTIDRTGVATLGSLVVTNSNLAGSITESKVLRSDGTGGQYIAREVHAAYDFATDGGAQGVITLADSGQFPNNSCVELIGYDVLTTFTSSSDAATVKVGLPTDGDLSTAIAISDSGNPWDAGYHLGSELTPIPLKTTSSRQVTMTVATENLTAGAAVFFFRVVGSA